MLAMPAEGDIARALKSDVDPDKVLEARRSLRRAIATALSAELLAARENVIVPSPTIQVRLRPSGGSSAPRRLTLPLQAVRRQPTPSQPRPMVPPTT